VLLSRVIEKWKIQRTSQTLLAANGSQIPVLGSAVAEAYTGDKAVEIQDVMTKHVTDLVIGSDWDFGKGEVTIDDMGGVAE